MKRHFLRLSDFSSQTLLAIVQSAIDNEGGNFGLPAKDKILALLFEKSSTRTRLSFQSGFTQLGGTSIFLPSNEIQIERGESIGDSARVISSMVDMIVMRTGSHRRLVDFAKHAHCPVINGLSDAYHPCQLLADIMTFMQLRGNIHNKLVAFIGDAGNNMCNSYIEASTVFNFSLHIACPDDFTPANVPEHVRVCNDPRQAVKNANLIVTDVWVSMGDEASKTKRMVALRPYQVTSELLDLGDNALFLHCLPAHRGEEVDDEVLDDSRSGVWQASTNRLHAQKALVSYMLQNFVS